MSSEGRVALVHDWLVGWGGSESVLLSLSRMFPDAPIHTFVWDPDPLVEERFGGRDIRPVVPNSVPGRGKIYKALLPLMPAGFAGIDLRDYDLVVSSSHAFSKAVRLRPDARHLCYCHTPPRYLWDLAETYLPSWKGRLTRPLLRRLRRRDGEAAAGVDEFVANSHTVAERIRRTYGRESRVVPPPVDVERFHAEVPRGDHLLAGGRLVRYKRVDLAVRAATRLGLPLKVFGRGPEERRLRRMAGPTVEFLGWVSDERLVRLLAGARAYLFPGEEDFGILPVEAQAAGCPVIAYAEGGAEDTIVDGLTGILFAEATVDGLIRALERLRADRPDPADCRVNAARFSRSRFEREMHQSIRDITSMADIDEGQRGMSTARPVDGCGPARRTRVPA